MELVTIKIDRLPTLLQGILEIAQSLAISILFFVSVAQLRSVASTGFAAGKIFTIIASVFFFVLSAWWLVSYVPVIVRYSLLRCYRLEIEDHKLKMLGRDGQPYAQIYDFEADIYRGSMRFYSSGDKRSLIAIPIKSIALSDQMAIRERSQSLRTKC